MATYKTLQDDALDRLNNTSAEARARICRYINEWHRRLCTEAGVGIVRDAETTLSTVAGTDEYTLASAVRKLRGIQDESRGVALEEVTLEYMRQVDPDDTMSGDPQFYAMRSDRKIKLKPKPSANGTLTLDYEARIVDLDEDVDEPLIPEDFHYLLSLGARLNEYEKLEDLQRLRIAQEEMASGIRRMKYWLAVRPRTVFRAGVSAGGSQLGPWFPAGS